MKLKTMISRFVTRDVPAMIDTRDGKRKYSYDEVLLSGLAPSGGLFVPDKYPKITHRQLEELKDKKYIDIAFTVKRLFTGTAFTDEELKSFIEKAYSKAKFDAYDGNITPLKQIDDKLFIQNLSLGPTAAFKDMAMQLLAQEMNFVLAKSGKNLSILGATSGDTGSSAEAAFKGLDRTKLLILSPEKGMSEFQKAQMGALSGGNIFNISVKGRFDDCQDLVKKLKKESEFSHLGAVNSINWGRITSQVPYYFAGYLQAVNKIGEKVDFVVPSGNFGNVLSAYIAKQMGLPIRRLIVATNENDVLHKLFATGVYELSPATVTSSPSMDISKASNYERLLFDLFDKDSGKTAKYMQEFADKGRVDLRDYGISVDDLEGLGFVSGKSTHQDRLNAIRKVYDNSGFVIDPHTADAVHTAYNTRDNGVITIAMMTALPVKFENTVKEALGFVPERPHRFANVEETAQNPDAFNVINNDPEELRNILRKYM